MLMKELFSLIGYWLPWAPARRRKMAELLGDTVRERREQIIRMGSEYKGKHVCISLDTLALAFITLNTGQLSELGH